MNHASDLNLVEFAQGASRYADHYVGKNLARIVLDVYLADESDAISVIVDTGAPWCVLDPALVQPIESQVFPNYKLETPLYIQGFPYGGWLYDIPIRLEAAIGESLTVEAVAFVPDLSPDEVWLYPNFIGLDGFLNRIRFAVDPTQNLFFFGDLF